MLFRQLFDPTTSTYTYLLADPKTRAAAIIDPVREQCERDARLLGELGLTLDWILDTHVHADHVTGAASLKRAVGGATVVSIHSGVDCADRFVDDGDRIVLGRFELEVRATPGHTSGCVTYLARGAIVPMAFTGDALLVRSCGRTDFQGGSARTLFHSVRERLFSLDEGTLVYPAHDYAGFTVSSIGEEKRHNPRLGLARTEAEFVAVMASLHLPNPRLMDVAVPANLHCGSPLPAHAPRRPPEARP